MTLKQIVSILKAGGYILHKIGYALYNVDGYYDSHITQTQMQKLLALDNVRNVGSDRYTWCADES